jgi:predicted peptidase
LCFLHGHDEGAPTPVREGLTRHGPLAGSSASSAAGEFVLVAAQMPARGDLWLRYTGQVQEIVQEVQALHGVDPERMYLTGFSFGGNGVFNLSLEQRGLWAALWPVDPARAPREDPGLPIWLSSGQISRRNAEKFIRRLRLQPLNDAEPGDRVYEDQGQDHVGTARLAYADERIYRWLLSKRLPDPAV